MKHIWKTYNLAVAVIGALIIGACASMGRPEGGPRDTEPPVPLNSTPPAGQLNFNGRRLVVNFNENIQLDDAFNKVVVSPAMSQPPAVSANGRRLTVEFRDTLRDSTTYTVDFADAVKDLNEGNILDGFALDFSTGPTIDTLRISGMVLGADNLEPAQGLLVGVRSNLADSAVSTLPLDRIARTNQLGQFTIRNLPAGQYRVFAIDDVNRDYKWDRSEAMAFYDVVVEPSVQTFELTDTLRSSQGTDSTALRQGLRYLPNDVLLSLYKEEYTPQYLKDYGRPERRKASIIFGAPADSLPQITITNGDFAGRDFNDFTIIQANGNLDSLTYWIRDPQLVEADTLRLAVTYIKPDSTGQLSQFTDSLRFDFRAPRQKKKKNEEQELDSLGNPIRTSFLDISALGGSQQELHRGLLLDFTEPLATVDSSAIRLEVQSDTLWLPVPDMKLLADSINPVLRKNIDYKWEPGAKYRLTIDSASIYNIYGDPNRPFKHEFTAKNEEDYSGITFNIEGLNPDTALVVELVGSSDQVQYRAQARGNKVVFHHLAPGTYYARLIIDSDGNGRWTSGDVALRRQPEETYYFPKKLTLKKNWDIEQAWNPYALPLDLQKPLAIKKNKPKLKAGEMKPVEEDEEEADSPFGAYDPNTGQLLPQRR
ncbi:MAG: Ig-like domain-containing protein [Muribaculaceae bacterium]|nr:Ig-like domain-containing protein [Muribaculaceae bacterium]